MGLLERDHLGEQNLLDRIERLEQRLADLERAAARGLFPGGGAECVLPGGLTVTLPTEDLQILDAGTVGATEAGWVAVDVGSGGYLRVYASK